MRFNLLFFFLQKMSNFGGAPSPWGFGGNMQGNNNAGMMGAGFSGGANLNNPQALAMGLISNLLSMQQQQQQMPNNVCWTQVY
jgi:hypothetical protein